MKLSFSISSKSLSISSKPVLKFVAEQQSDGDRTPTNHQFIKEFKSSKTLTNTSSKNLVIPPIESEWRPVKKMRNIDLTAEFNGQRLEFEPEASSSVNLLDSGMLFGLNLHKTNKKDVGKGKEFAKKEYIEWAAPRCIGSGKNVLLRKLKDDLEGLPDHRGLEEFVDVPVEGFGASVLAGYGWYEGRGIGKNPKGDLKFVEYEKRSGREGLGFVAAVPVSESKKFSGKNESEERKDSKRKRDVDGRGCSRVSWLTSYIRVRIISKELKGGRLYLKKGEVVDVVGPHTCDIAMDLTRELIQGVDQELLETALPKHGEPVRVLCGKHKGIFGYLVEKDVDKETGVVRDADTHDLLNVKLEQIAEFIGDPSLIGY